MKQQMLEMLAAMKAVDIAQTPGYKWRLALLKDPRLKLPVSVLYTTVGQLKVEVTEAFAADPELWDASLDATATMLSNLWALVANDLNATGALGRENAMEYFLGITREFTLKYNA
jgi:hypothetical protein